MKTSSLFLMASALLLSAGAVFGAPSPLPPPPKSVVITSGHIVLDQQNGILRVMEMLTVENQSDETYEGISMGPRVKISLRFPVPKGAGNLAALPESGPGLIPVGVGFGYTKPLPPGKKMLAYTYELPLSEGQIRFEKIYRYAVSDLSILAAESGLKLAINGAHEAETVSLEGRTYQRFHADSLGAEEPLVIEAVVISGSMIRSPGSNDSRSNMSSAPIFPAASWGLVGAGSGIVLLIGAYLVGYARGRALSAEAPNPDDLRRELVAEIAVLDDRHEAGSLGKEEWEKKRSILRNRLTELLRGSSP